MTITVMFITAAIVAGSTKIVLFSKESTDHQLNRLHSNQIVTDEYTITFDERISIREFLFLYEYFIKKDCRIQPKPPMRKYRTNKGFMT